MTVFALTEFNNMKHDLDIPSSFLEFSFIFFMWIFVSKDSKIQSLFIL